MIQIPSVHCGLRLLSAAVNQDGRTTNLTSPNGIAQQKVISRALDIAALESNMPRLLDAHGTGTALGDPIETAAQQAVFWRARRRADLLATGAIKSNIGHLEAGAGLVGLLELQQSLCCYEVLPNLHLQKVNGYIDTADYAVTLPSAISSLCCDELTGGVSSFGFGGTNTHVLLASTGQDAQYMLLNEQVAVEYRQTPFIWWDSDAFKARKNVHSFLGAQLESADVTIWQCSWPKNVCSYLADHRVGNTPLVPGTCFLQMVRCATTGAVELSATRFVAALLLDSGLPTVRISVANNRVWVDSTRVADWTQHTSMTIENTARSMLMIERECSIATTQCTMIETSRFYGSIGNGYRGEFRSVDAVWVHAHNNAILARVAVAEASSLVSQSPYCVCPTLSRNASDCCSNVFALSI